MLSTSNSLEPETALKKVVSSSLRRGLLSQGVRLRTVLPSTGEIHGCKLGGPDIAVACRHISCQAVHAAERVETRVLPQGDSLLEKFEIPP